MSIKLSATSIIGYPNYSISKTGEVFNNKRNKQKIPFVDKDGYLKVTLYNNGRGKCTSVHRLVLETYVGLCPEGMECRHLNGNPADNRFENLCWDTHSENNFDRARHRVDMGVKLTAWQVRFLIYIHRTGLVCRKELAKLFDVTQAMVSYILTKQSWRWIWETIQ